jgi:hypothetical protein
MVRAVMAVLAMVLAEACDVMLDSGVDVLDRGGEGRELRVRAGEARGLRIVDGKVLVDVLRVQCRPHRGRGGWSWCCSVSLDPTFGAKVSGVPRSPQACMRLNHVRSL